MGDNRAYVRGFYDVYPNNKFQKTNLDNWIMMQIGPQVDLNLVTFLRAEYEAELANRHLTHAGNICRNDPNPSLQAIGEAILACQLAGGILQNQAPHPQPQPQPQIQFDHQVSPIVNQMMNRFGGTIQWGVTLNQRGRWPQGEHNRYLWGISLYQFNWVQFPLTIKTPKQAESHHTTTSTHVLNSFLTRLYQLQNPDITILPLAHQLAGVFPNTINWPISLSILGDWEEQDHIDFLHGLATLGRGNWADFVEILPNKTPLQLRKHYSLLSVDVFNSLIQNLNQPLNAF